MSKDIKEIIKKYSKYIKNNKRLALIFIIGLGLILFSTAEKETESKIPAQTTDCFLEYKAHMEKELCCILSDIKGAGEVSVMITLKDYGDTHYAVDESENSFSKDSEKEQSRQTQHVFKKNSSNADEPLVTKKIFPQISGVLVCARGAGNAQVKNNITSSVEALLGIGSHRVVVMERK